MGSRPVLKFRASELVVSLVDHIAEEAGTTRSQVLRDFVDTAIWLYHPDTEIGEVFSDEALAAMDIDPETPFYEVVESRPEALSPDDADETDG